MQLNLENKKCTNLDFVGKLTKGNPAMIREMIEVYLEETPKLLDSMKKAIDRKDWDSLARTAHAMVPSFTTVGISNEFTDLTKAIQNMAEKREGATSIQENFRKVENVCRQAREELKQELNLLKTK